LSKKKSQKQKPDSSPRRRWQILSVVLMLAALFLIVSIVTFSDDDIRIVEGRSFVSLFSSSFSPQEAGKPETPINVNNSLGLFGAWVANFCITFSLGYPVIAFPFLILLWGSTILFRWNTIKLVVFTSYAVIFSLLLSSFFGIVPRMFSLQLSSSWSGVVGAFLAEGFIKFLGNVGAFLITLAGLFITFVLAAKIDLFRAAQGMKSATTTSFQWIKEKFSNEKSNDDEPGDSFFSIKKTDDEVENESITDDYEEECFDEEASKEQEEQTISPPIIEIRKEPEPRKIVSPKKKEQKYSHETEIVKGALPEDQLDYVLPSVDLLEPIKKQEEISKDELEANAELVKVKLANFDVNIEKVAVTPGPVVTLYELTPATDVKISRIVALQDDLQLALSARGIRIIAPIPGRNTVGVEIPNRNPSIVQLRSIIHSSRFQESKGKLVLGIGKTISGEIYVDDLSKMPHLLIAGATGSGKSVGINTIVMSLLYRMYPHELKFVIVDPKKIEMSHYAALRNHYLAVSPDIDEDIITNSNNAVIVLKSLTFEMDARYDLLANAGVRNISDYNEKFNAGKIPVSAEEENRIRHRRLPYIVVVIDELADLMLTAGKDVETSIARLAQMARAVGIHLVLATQRPSVDVITGVIKANFPARIAYQVATKIDSRTILDMNGAEQLIGQGDMLFLPGSNPKPMRMQNAFVSTEEVERVTDYIASQPGYAEPYRLPSIVEKKQTGINGEEIAGLDDKLIVEAAHLVVAHQQGSVSLLQRRLEVGYARAGKLIDALEKIGVVGPHTGSKARDVLIDTEEELSRILESWNIR